MVVFGLFGLLTFPLRLIRRGQRKQQHVAEVQLATMQAMMLQQQAQQAQELAEGAHEQAGLPPPVLDGAALPTKRSSEEEGSEDREN